nr:MAG TPA: hypothetical protein [Caudoviricetes sp.]
MRLTHPAGLPCYFVVKMPNKALFIYALCCFFLTYANFY